MKVWFSKNEGDGYATEWTDTFKTSHVVEMDARPRPGLMQAGRHNFTLEARDVLGNEATTFGSIRMAKVYETAWCSRLTSCQMTGVDAPYTFENRSGCLLKAALKFTLRCSGEAWAKVWFSRKVPCAHKCLGHTFGWTDVARRNHTVELDARGLKKLLEPGTHMWTVTARDSVSGKEVSRRGHINVTAPLAGAAFCKNTTCRVAHVSTPNRYARRSGCLRKAALRIKLICSGEVRRAKVWFSTEVACSGKCSGHASEWTDLASSNHTIELDARGRQGLLESGMHTWMVTAGDPANGKEVSRRGEINVRGPRTGTTFCVGPEDAQVLTS